jgi:hypothetical protein
MKTPGFVITASIFGMVHAIIIGGFSCLAIASAGFGGGWYHVLIGLIGLIVALVLIASAFASMFKKRNLARKTAFVLVALTTAVFIFMPSSELSMNYLVIPGVFSSIFYFISFFDPKSKAFFSSASSI